MILRNFSFTASIYCLHENLAVVWNLHRSAFHLAWTHVIADNEVTLHRSEISPVSEISNRFDFTSGLM